MSDFAGRHIWNRVEGWNADGLDQEMAVSADIDDSREGVDSTVKSRCMKMVVDMSCKRNPQWKGESVPAFA